MVTWPQKPCRQGRPLVTTLGSCWLRRRGADPGDQLLTGSDAELAGDVPEVELDGLDADVQLGGGLPVGPAGGDQAGHRLLSRGEADEGGYGFRPRGRACSGELPVAGLQVGTPAQGNQVLAG